jgi:hypothetical protein
MPCWSLGLAMRRRDFINALAGAAIIWPLPARGQQSERMRRIGVLMGYAESDPAAQTQVSAFRAALAKLGWTEGSNLRIEVRWGAGEAGRISTLAKELVELQPDAILGATTPVISARGDDLVKEFRFVLAVKARPSRVKRLAHEPGCFVVEISPGANERQDCCHSLPPN